jgi:hypothetical protein
MSPEMRRSLSDENLSNELPNTDIFSLGLMALYCLDANEFSSHLLPLLRATQNSENLEEKLLTYLDDFRQRNINSPSIMNFLYSLKNMLSFSPRARPTIKQLYEDFPKLSSNLVYNFYFIIIYTLIS